MQFSELLKTIHTQHEAQIEMLAERIADQNVYIRQLINEKMESQVVSKRK